MRLFLTLIVSGIFFAACGSGGGGGGGMTNRAFMKTDGTVGGGGMTSRMGGVGWDLANSLKVKNVANICLCRVDLNMENTDAVAAPSIPIAKMKIKMGSKTALTPPPAKVDIIDNFASPTALNAPPNAIARQITGSDGTRIYK